MVINEEEINGKHFKCPLCQGLCLRGNRTWAHQAIWLAAKSKDFLAHNLRRPMRASLLPGVKYGRCTSVFVIQSPLEMISGEDKWHKVINLRAMWLLMEVRGALHSCGSWTCSRLRQSEWLYHSTIFSCQWGYERGGWKVAQGRRKPILSEKS